MVEFEFDDWNPDRASHSPQPPSVGDAVCALSVEFHMQRLGYMSRSYNLLSFICLMQAPTTQYFAWIIAPAKISTLTSTSQEIGVAD